MDVFEFYSKKDRYCLRHDCERNCLIYQECYDDFTPRAKLERAVEEIEKWTEEHPIQTRQSEFMKLYPNVHLSMDVVDIDPCTLDESYKKGSCRCGGCENCRKEYWTAEVE